MESLQSHYRINIAKAQDYQPDNDIRYKHHFAIDIIHEDQAKEVHAEMVKNYPDPDYNITVTHWDIGGRSCEW